MCFCLYLNLRSYPAGPSGAWPRLVAMLVCGVRHVVNMTCGGLSSVTLHCVEHCWGETRPSHLLLTATSRYLVSSHPQTGARSEI